MKGCNGWIQTDSDCYQYCKKLNDNCYWYIELREVGDFENPFYWVYATQMDLEFYTDDEIADYITGYYDDVEQIREIYGDEANQIIAECIFECLPAIEHTFVKEMKFEADAIDFIHKFIENH